LPCSQRRASAGQWPPGRRGGGWEPEGGGVGPGRHDRLGAGDEDGPLGGDEPDELDGDGEGDGTGDGVHVGDGDGCGCWWLPDHTPDQMTWTVWAVTVPCCM